jgi:hypothetical protein
MPADPPRLSPLAAAMIAGLTVYRDLVRDARDEVRPPPFDLIILKADPDSLGSRAFAELMLALNDLAWAEGGSGVERVGPRAFRILRDQENRS